MKAFTDLEQSKKLAEFLPLESADMTLPFRHTKDNKYLPGYVIARTYTEVYNEMIVLPGMKKQELCKLINPCWSLAALMDILEREAVFKTPKEWACQTYIDFKAITSDYYNNPIDACVAMIEKLHEQKLL